MTEDLFLGWDLSTTQLKGIVVNSHLKLVYEASADFDEDFGSKYGIEKGVLTRPNEGEIFSPPAMWLEAVDLVLSRLQKEGLDCSKVRGISGAGMQHGTVFWSLDAEHLLGDLKGDKTLAQQLKGAFSHPYSPNWQDSSTQEQCEQFDAELGSAQELAEVTGSKAHHRFSGPQILRFRQKHPEKYHATARISLVSSFLCSIFLGKIADIDIGDVCGMNLREIKTGKWNQKLLKLCAGEGGVEELEKKLGRIPEDGGGSRGTISNYYVERYGFDSKCEIAPFTGDNPSTILALPLRASDAIVSLGTSTTFLMSTSQYKPDPAYHFMNHPTTAGLYMFMLCYKNGSLARERVRDAVDGPSDSGSGNQSKAFKKTWDAFNAIALQTPPLGQSDSDLQQPMKLGLFFPRPEIVPQLPAGEWLFLYQPASTSIAKPTHHPVLKQVTPTRTTSTHTTADGKTDDHSVWRHPHDTVRATLESQFLSCRLRAAPLLHAQGSLPAQPRRIYIVGGGAVNPAIAQICGEVLGGAEGVYRLDIGGNACALGAAYKAVWAVERAEGETFEELIGARWREEDFVEKVDVGYREGVWERYGEALQGFREMEEVVVRGEEEKRHPERPHWGRMVSAAVGSALTRERTGEMGG